MFESSTYLCSFDLINVGMYHCGKILSLFLLQIQHHIVTNRHFDAVSLLNAVQVMTVHLCVGYLTFESKGIDSLSKCVCDNILNVTRFWYKFRYI